MAKTTTKDTSEGTSRTKSAKSLKVAVIGCGYWGKNHVRNFAELGGLGAVCDPNADLAHRFGEQYGVAVMSMSEALASDDIDGVVVAAPAEHHYSLAKMALTAGKHVFVEKPLALKVQDAKKLIALADKADRILMVGHLLQYHPVFRKLKELIASGKMGRLQYIYSNRLNLGKIRREENILWSFAPHDISMILSVVNGPVRSVSTKASYYLHQEIADVTVTNISFADGVNAHIFVSWLHPFKEQKLIVVGDRGMAVFDDGEDWPDKLRLYAHKIEWHDGHPVPHKDEGQSVVVEPSEPLRDECQHFLDCIAEKKTPLTDGREGLAVLEVLDAAEQSMRSGETVRLGGKRQDFSTPDEKFFVHPTACVDTGAKIGAGSKIWHFSHVMPSARIGENVVIGQNAYVGANVIVGDKCKIQNNVSLYEGVVLEDGVFCGPSCVFTNVNNPRAEIERKDEYRPTLVRKGASIGANATIVCGAEIGAYSFVAAGAVVTRDVPDFALVAGVPAQQMGWVSREGERLGDDLVCPRSGRTYEIDDTGRLKEMSK